MTDPFYKSETVHCPYPYYAELRQQDPVHRLEGEDVFLVTQHADCERVLAEPEVYSNKAGPGLRQSELMGTAKAPEDSPYRVVRTLLTNDPPSHTRYRKLVAKAFSARRVAAMEPKIRALADELIDTFPADGKLDFVRDFARPLPLTVIADFLGVPRSDLGIFRKWSDDAAEVLGGTLTPERSKECHDSLQELLGYFDQRLAERRLQPSEDFLGLLLDARVGGERPLTTEEMLSISYVTLVAGNETTVNLLSSMMLLLLRNPDQLARVRADHSKIPVAVEEALRMEAPVQGSMRRAKQDTELAGRHIPEGSRVLIVSGSANRDPEVFADADRFDVDRTNPRSHLSFGKGIHFCLGAALSRLEGTVALEHLLARLDSIEVDPDFVPSYQDNAVLRSLRSLPVHVRKESA
ncbi:Cytochrome P450 [Haloechinothrix alba]|uniref:Cytochrome P450 n=1 Tax=Haloechinothrix alba TaxID=664784 RepID=A0A239AAU2_9PSEU|nr:cytochrome P450 [Haloechinothrix alba]SNR92720.1 Cytochrome P450 [Haloechinothrix alba]